MKTSLLITLLTLVSTPAFATTSLGSDPQPVSQMSTIFSSPAIAAICADGVTPHPTLKNIWHIDRPRFAVTADAVYATMDLRPTPAGEFTVVKIDPRQPATYTEVARFQDPIHDLKIHDGKIWVLFPNHLVALDAQTGGKVLDVPTNPTDEAGAQGFAWVGNQLVIANGPQGMMIFDPVAGKITNENSLGLTNNGLVSKVIDVTAINDHEVAFAVEAVTLPKQAPFPFTGIMTVDLNGSAIQRFAYDRATAGVVSYARIAVSGDDLFVNNWGILQRLSLSAMKTSGAATPSWIPVKFDANGVSETGELLGDLVVDHGSIGSCAQISYRDEQTHKILHKGLVYNQAY